MSLTSSEQDLQRQVMLTKQQLRDLRTSNESNQAKLLDHSQRQGRLPFKPHISEFTFFLRPRGCFQACRSRHDRRRLGSRQ